jgi:4-amino-4-deoxy-L-arabinose transferase-like glycosyltransferase
MDDVDAVQAQIARNMLDSGDWVTARLNGVAYLEKSPLVYWMIASSFAIFGVHDWAARLPIATSAVALCWLTARMGAWAFSPRAGLYSGLVLATSVGLFLFTRILIPDVILTLTVTLAMWSFLRALEAPSLKWPRLMAASIAIGLLLKGLIAAVFPIAAAGLYLLFTRQMFVHETWRRLRPFEGLAILLMIAAPWHVMATLRNPPYFDLTPRSEPGQYHGFFWFYFLNEHVFRFLNMRHPRDYNTVPRHLFWLFHLLWFYPWSAFLPGVLKLRYSPDDRAGRMRLLALCWIGFVMVFFTLSTTQEYYSMPIYPAVALLLGCAMAEPGRHARISSTVVAVAASAAAAVIAAILYRVWNLPAPGDISNALVTQDYSSYTLSLGHMGDLTLASFAYLKTPLVIAGVAFIIGALGSMRFRQHRTYMILGCMMVLFLQAARLAMVTFDPYLSSRALAESLNDAPPGQLIVDNQYYTFSSVFFYTNRRALLLNGRVNNLQYGSYAPGAPDVFIDDRRFAELWRTPETYYVTLERPAVPRIESLVGRDALHTVASSGGKFLFTNHARSH